MTESLRARWSEAVETGAQGFYAAAWSQLGELLRELSPINTSYRAQRSLALSTAASLHRQLGRYRQSANLDGAAVSLTAADRSALHSSHDVSSDPDAIRTLEAWCDAMTGLAADMIGSARFSSALPMLEQVSAVVDQNDLPQLWRQSLRLNWVRAEYFLFAGSPDAALPYARLAVEQALQGPSVRHKIKSSLILSATHAAVGEQNFARSEALECHTAAVAGQFLPLAWVSTQILLGADLPAKRTKWRQTGRAYAVELSRRGGRIE
ncbi:hypothetical protein IEU95_04895 [Hoyosella rhizosphaerae]|uniref:Uncharacterized protein n=1 Tax=Hoyosella rhizosphaerae TaxID=1755582 RepID=A0A916U946_9ACTN|nr:hypothetical protein [Hoyosella rhizosphaerae]MBN4926155.1 hypothetical protein [Hoyosella rhizosphaerae]GGC65090.1 hypothetical protein GCM10011410_16990 [Hoyosella rhizosphaerae]